MLPAVGDVRPSDSRRSGNDMAIIVVMIAINQAMMPMIWLSYQGMTMINLVKSSMMWLEYHIILVKKSPATLL